MNTSDDHEARRQAKLTALQDSRDKLDDKVYYWWQQGFSKTTIAKMLGFKTANQLARSFNACEIRKRDEEIDRLVEENTELQLEIAELQGKPYANKRELGIKRRDETIAELTAEIAKLKGGSE